MLGPSHYAELVADARRQRGLIEDHGMDWVVVRNRLAALETRNRKNVARGLEAIASRLDFRLAEGITERVVFREFFLRGLTALDQLNEKTLGAEPSMSHLAARREILALIDSLNLPIRRGRGGETDDGGPEIRSSATGHGQAEMGGGALYAAPPERG
jgi:chromosome partitioning protein